MSVPHSQLYVLKRHSKGCAEANGEDGQDDAALPGSSTVVASLFLREKKSAGTLKCNSVFQESGKRARAALRIEHLPWVVVSL